MLEFLRKHTVVVMAAVALVFIGLVFLNDGSGPSLWGNNAPPLFEIDGTTYTYKDYQDKYDRYIRTAFRLQSVSGKFFRQLPAQMKDAEYATLLNVLLVRKEAKRYGLHPGKEEIDRIISILPEFSNEKGQFDPQKYEEFVSWGGKSYKPQNEAAVREVVSDALCLNMIENLVSDGVDTNNAFAKSFFESLNQTMDINTALLKEEDYRPKTDPSEDQIKEFWDKFKNNFLSEPTRDVTVYLFKPKAEIVATGDNKIPAATIEVLNLVEVLWDNIIQANANGLEDKINQFVKDQEQLLSFEKSVFTEVTRDANKAPELLKMKLNKGTEGENPPSLFERAQKLAAHVPGRKDTNENGTPVETKREQDPGKLTNDNVSTTLVLEDGTIALMTVTNIRAASPLPYNEARSAARARLIDQLTEDNMLKAARELREKLIKEAKTPDQFNTIAKAAGAEIKNWPAVTKSASNAGLIKGPEIFNSLRKVNDGGISDVIEAPGDGAVIAQLVKRTIPDTPQSAQLQELGIGEIDILTRDYMLLPDWMFDCMKKYNVKIFVSNQNEADNY